MPALSSCTLRSRAQQRNEIVRPPTPAASTSSKPAQAPPPSLEERTVKQLRLTKALTLPEATVVSDACRRMAARRADAALLTDAKGVLSGIVTADDISGRVIAEGLRPEETSMAMVMTRTPVFVMSNASATEALQKMVQGKFRHLPVVENGEVTTMLDITKFLWDAISRMEQAAEQGSAITAAMEGVERQWGNEFAGGQIVACLDALLLTQASISMVEGASGRNNVANAMVQKFLDSGPALHPAEEYDKHSEESRTAASDSAEGKQTPPHVGNAFSFKIEDRKGRMHRFSCVPESLDELVSAVAFRLGTEKEKANVNLLVLSFHMEDGSETETDRGCVHFLVARRCLGGVERLAVVPRVGDRGRCGCGRWRRGNRLLETLRESDLKHT